MRACLTAAGCVRPCPQPRLVDVPCRFRLHRRRGLDLEHLVESHTINTAMKDLLLDAVERGDNLLVSGSHQQRQNHLVECLVLCYSKA